MSLIQDLRDRKLTGCRGCDAVRKGLYRGLDLWKPDSRIQVASTHDTSGASPLGAFLLSNLDARTDCLVSIDSITASTFADGDSVVIAGVGFGASEPAAGVALNSAQDKSGTNVAQTIDSWSNTSITITAVRGALSLGTVYLFVDCEMVGNAVTLESAIPCWSDVQSGTVSYCSPLSSVGLAVFRWAKKDLGGGDWAIKPYIGTIKWYGPSGICQFYVSGVWRWWYNGTTNFVDANVTISTAAGQSAFPLCSGGEWPSDTSADPPRWTISSATANLPAGVEPNTIDKVQSTTGDIFLISPGLDPSENI